MAPATPRCKHTRLDPRCRSCRSLKRAWYQRLEREGFVDVEYGLEHARFTAHTPDPGSPGAEQAQAYYESIWQVFHQWSASGRSLRDRRVAELYAEQSGDTGTVRGISRLLKQEGLAPWSPGRVQITLKEIHQAALALCWRNPSIPVHYVIRRHKSA